MRIVPFSAKGPDCPNISAVAIPIFNRTGQIIATNNMSGVTGSLEVEPESELVKELKNQANLISQDLGWNNYS